MQDSGEIIAVERDSKRIKNLQDNLGTLGISSVNVVNADLGRLKASEVGMFDKILLDAPCSSIGVIRKNPDVKYRHTAADLSKNGARQLELLRSASFLLKETGQLVYSVCSTEPEEGEHVITEFLKTATDFRIIDDVKYDFLRPFVEKGFFRTYPHRHAMDGFFGVTLCKKR
jgi:16S rRNA (cytosine967-C5)-methyltransferase